MLFLTGTVYKQTSHSSQWPYVLPLKSKSKCKVIRTQQISDTSHRSKIAHSRINLGTLDERWVGDRYIDDGLIGHVKWVHKLAKIFHGMGNHFKNEKRLDK